MKIQAGTTSPAEFSDYIVLLDSVQLLHPIEADDEEGYAIVIEDSQFYNPRWGFKEEVRKEGEIEIISSEEWEARIEEFKTRNAHIL